MAKKQGVARKPFHSGDLRSSVPALVIFTDIRGFTRWSENTEVFAHLNRFVSDFLQIVRRHAAQQPGLVKGLGDGAMIVRELTEAENQAEGLLPRVLTLIATVENDFQSLCKAFGDEVGQQTDLRLGWGVVRGEVKKLEKDYVGSNVNKAARLCDVARPWGIVLDKADFPHAEKNPSPRFYPQTRRLSGLAEAEVWVTEEIYTQFVPRERLRENPEVHVAGMCVADTAREVRLLLATRKEQRELFGGKMEGCGGQLRASETFAEGVMRHFQLEMGIQVSVLEEYHCFYVIEKPNHPKIPGIRFLCQQVDNRVPSSPNHSEVRWVPEEEFRALPPERFPGNLKEEVLQLLERYKKDKQSRRKTR
jgi:class 3 adenylate cyclase/8-oxo-dGTP pyrophosphatase MutT (NUDIX family)